MPPSTLYDDDILLWSEQQAEVIRGLAERVRGLPNDLDIENVAEEIESVGRSELASVESQVANILRHLVKLSLMPPDAQPRRHWQAETLEFHARLKRRYARSMAQRIDLDAVWQSAAEIAILGMTEIDERPEVPEACPLKLDQILASKLDVPALVRAVETAFHEAAGAHR